MGIKSQKNLTMHTLTVKEPKNNLKNSLKNYKTLKNAKKYFNKTSLYNSKSLTNFSKKNQAEMNLFLSRNDTQDMKLA